MTGRKLQRVPEPDEPDPNDPSLYPHSTVWPDAWVKLLYAHRVSEARSSDYVVTVRVPRGTGLEHVRAKAPVADIIDGILASDDARQILLERLAAWSDQQRTERLAHVLWAHRHFRHSGDCGCFAKLLADDDGE